MHLLGEGPQAQDLLVFASGLPELEPTLTVIASFSPGEKRWWFTGSPSSLLLKEAVGDLFALAFKIKVTSI